MYLKRNSFQSTSIHVNFQSWRIKCPLSSSATENDYDMQPHLVDGEGDPEGDDPHVVEEEDHEDDIPE